MKKLAISTFALTLLMAALIPVSAAEAKQKTIIAVDDTPAYTFPSVLDKSWDRLPYGQEIHDLGGTPGWNTIVHNGITAYVSKTKTSLYTPIKEKGIFVRTQKAYLFSIPKEGSQSRGSAAKGTVLRAIGKYGKWYYVSSTDSDGKQLKGFISSTVAW